MAYTFEELQKMGAKPVAPAQPAATSPAPTMSASVQATSSPKKKYTPQELAALGAKPVTAAPTAPEIKTDVKGGFLGEILTGNTQRFGKTIGESLAAPKNAEMYAEAVQSHTKLQNDLVKRIKEKREKGEDTTRLERALEAYIEDTPKLEDFTGDVINKTGGQVAGEALGTALEVLPFGTYGKGAAGMKSGQLAQKASPVLPTAVEAGKNLVTQPAKKFATKELGKQTLESAAFGYGVDVSQGLQEGEGAGSFKPGMGTLIGALAPATLKGVGIGAGKTASAVRNTIEDRARKAAGEADHLIGTIIQGEAKDIPLARKAFSEVDIKDIRNYSDLKDSLNEKIKTLKGKQQEALDYEPYVKPLDEMDVKVRSGDVEVSHNFVKDALDDLEDYYTKSGDVAEAARIRSIRQKAQSNGLGVKEIDELAVEHGNQLDAFSAKGQISTSPRKMAWENTRKGLKQTAREQFNSKVYNETDEVLSAMIRTRDLVQNMEDAVLKLEQKTRDPSIPERLGAAIEQVLNFVTFGTSRGFLQSGRDLGLFKSKTNMTALDLEERLGKHIKRLNEILEDTNPNSMEKKLNDFLQENKVPVSKPPKLNVKQPPKVFAPEAMPKSTKPVATGKDIEIGITSFRGKPVKRISETLPYYLSTRAKGFERSLKQPQSAKIVVGEIKKVAGSWEGSIEPSFSVVVRGPQKDTLAYAAEKAKRANQDAVILFTGGKGNGAKYSFEVKKDPDRALKALHKEGISGATVDGKTIKVYDTDGSLANQVDKFSKLIGVKPTKENGTVKLIFKNEYDRYIGGSGAGNGNSVRPKAPEPKLPSKPTKLSGKNKGSAKVGALVAGAAGSLPFLGSKISYTAPEQPVTPKVEQKPKTIPPEKLGSVLAMLESSGGTDKRSADPGEMKWLTGLTDVAIKELKRLGIKPSVNVANAQDVVDASVKYFNLLRERNPGLSDAEIYADKYWTQWKNMKDPQAARQRAIEKFNSLTQS